MFVHGGYYSFDHDVRLPRSGRGAAVAGLRVCSLAQSMWKSECRNEFSPWRWWLQKTRALGSLRRSDPGSSVMFVHGGYYSFDHDVRLPRSGRGAAVAGLRVCSLAQSMWKSECRNEFSPWRWSTPWIKKCRPRKARYFFDGLPLGRGAPVQCWI